MTPLDVDGTIDAAAENLDEDDDDVVIRSSGIEAFIVHSQ